MTRQRALTLCPSCGALAGELHAEDCATAWATEQAAALQVASPECRTPPGRPHAEGCPQDCNLADSARLRGTNDSPVSIPLEVQERLFECEYQRIVRQIAMWLDECEEPEHADFDAELRDLALSRLRSGFESYRSTMFTWDAETRRRNVLEELADAIVYLTSGPVE